MKTVMVFGTFDIVHLGHITLFKIAKKYGENLIVVVARDKRAKEVKGKAPLFSEKERVAFIKELSLVTKVVLGHPTNIYQRIKEIKPDTIVLGYDQKVFTDKLKENIKKLGLTTEIVRAKAYKPEYLKTNKLKKHLLKSV